MITFQNAFDSKISKISRDIINSAFNGMKEERDSGRIGYYDLPFSGEDVLNELEKYKKENPLLKDDSIRDIVVLGVGGSSLGTKAIFRLLKRQTKTKKRLFFLENVDPIKIKENLKDVKKKKALFILISKSGGTIETLSIFKYVLKKYKLKLGEEKSNQRLMFITDRGSPLSKLANKNGIKQFNIPLNVGGRFSVLSAVGIVPLALMDVDVKGILEGAQQYTCSFFDRKDEKVLEKAFFYAKSANEHPINVLFSYSSLFVHFNQWYVQLWAESLGKYDKFDNKIGLTPVQLVGSVDQHSFLQLIVQGPTNKTVTFLKINDYESDISIPEISLENLSKIDYINGHKFDTLLNEECNATYETLVDQKLPVDMIVLNKLKPANVGVLIIYYELLTSAVAQMLDIDAYDQPGVEFGKIKLIEKFSKTVVAQKCDI